MACEEQAIELKTPSRGLGLALDGLIGAVLFSFVYLPAPGLVAGLVFLNDGFHHWNHFVIAPALAHQHGIALSLDTHSPYGLGWPTLMSFISGLWPLSHQNMIEFASIFAGAYFIGLYFLFRLAVSRRGLALAGTFFALWLGFFSPLFMEIPRLETSWQWPSMLILRAPFDGMFFLALLVHARNGRPIFSIFAAALAGLSLLFETDTGLMIVGTFVVYWSCALFFGGGREDVAARDGTGIIPIRPLRTLVLSFAVFVLVMALGFAVATHGRFVSEPGAVLAIWLGGLTNAISVSARLFTKFVVEDPEHLPLALGLLGVCLFAVSETALKALHRQLDSMSLFLGCVGFYGVGRLVLFIWNTEAIRTRFAGVGVAIILTVAVLRTIEALERWSRASGEPGLTRLCALATPVVLLLAGCLLLSSPTFADYPNSWRLKKTQLPSDGEFLIPERQEIWMPRPMDRQLGEPIREVIEKARGLTNDGERVAVIDSLRTFVYLEAGAKPWTGDAALFMNTWTREAARELVDRFRETGPRYVLVRRFPPNSKLIRDTWIELRESLRPTYHVVEQLSEFDLLRCDSCDDR
jgi:hypothetical protein